MNYYFTSANSFFRGSTKSVLCQLLLFALSCSALQAQEITLQHLSTYATGVFDEGASEIVTYDKKSNRLFSTNALLSSVDIIDFSDPNNLTLILQLDLTPYGAGPNGIAAYNGWFVVAIENEVKQEPGVAAFFDANGNFITSVTVGALPDAVKISPDGKTVLVSNEGEPDADYLVDPEGTISIIHLPDDLADLQQSDVVTADFSAFNNAILDASVRTTNNPGNSTVAMDLEPEYGAFSPDGQTAYVTLQENNAIAIVDIASGTVTAIKGLGFKDHTQAQNSFDASNSDDTINIVTHPTLGMYMPDAIGTYLFNQSTFLVTANEGDSRDYDGFSEETRVKDVVLDSLKFPNRDELQANENLGRLLMTTSNGDIDNDGDFDQIYSFGARSFSIWDANGNLVYDSANDFELITADAFPDFFNASNANNSFDNRSDDKGPEPEALEIMHIGPYVYALIGLERVGGIMIYNITNPQNVFFVDYINNRDFTADIESPEAGDLGIEEIIHIQKGCDHYVITANEISGTVSAFKVITNLPFTDMDGDDVPDYCDNCAMAYNPEQGDNDKNGIGDVCDYVLVAKESIDLEESVVHSGGVGATDDDGEVEVEGDSRVINPGTFVQAEEIEVDNDAEVEVLIYEPARPTLPEFLYNPHNSQNNVEVDDDEFIVLDGNIYEDIEVEDGATIVFSGHGEVYIESLKTEDDVTILFDQCTNLILSKKLKIGEDNIINPNGLRVNFFIEESAEIKKRSTVYATVYTKDKLKLKKASKNNRTNLHGLYIAEKVDAQDYVDFYAFTFEQCDGFETQYRTAPDNAILASKADNRESKSDLTSSLQTPSANWELYPNPAASTIHLQMPTDNNTIATSRNVAVRVVNLQGQTVLANQLDSFDGALIDLDISQLQDGIYMLVVQVDGDRATTLQFMVKQ